MDPELEKKLKENKISLESEYEVQYVNVVSVLQQSVTGFICLKSINSTEKNYLEYIVFDKLYSHLKRKYRWIHT